MHSHLNFRIFLPVKPTFEYLASGERYVDPAADYALPEVTREDEGR